MRRIVRPVEFAAEPLPNRVQKFWTALCLRVAVAVLFNRFDRSALQHLRHRKVWLANREIDRILQMRREIEDLANATCINRLGATRK